MRPLAGTKSNHPLPTVFVHAIPLETIPKWDTKQIPVGDEFEASPTLYLHPG